MFKSSSKKTNTKVLLEHHHTVLEELICHLPIAIFSVAFSMIILSFLAYADISGKNSAGTSLLFHNFHFLHLLYASTGAVLTFRRYSKNIVKGMIVGFFVPVVFCTLSDAILPYVAGELLGIHMHFHWCFLSHLKTVLPFVFVGMINGWLTSGHNSKKTMFYSQGFHFLHIFISSMASILYLVSFGFSNWWEQIGIVFLLLILIVLIPCTLSDIVVPMLFATNRKTVKQDKAAFYGASTSGHEEDYVKNKIVHK